MKNCPVCDAKLFHKAIDVEGKRHKMIGVYDECRKCQYDYHGDMFEWTETIGFIVLDYQFRQNDDVRILFPEVNKYAREREAALEETRRLWKNDEFRKLVKEGAKKKKYDPEYAKRVNDWMTAHATDYPLSAVACQKTCRQVEKEGRRKPRENKAGK